MLAFSRHEFLYVFPLTCPFSHSFFEPGLGDLAGVFRKALVYLLFVRSNVALFGLFEYCRQGLTTFNVAGVVLSLGVGIEARRRENQAPRPRGPVSK